MKKKKEKGKKETKTKLQLTELLHYCALLRKLLSFFTVPISIEVVAPIRTPIAVHLMISFAIHAFEDVRTWLTIFGYQMISFLILHATPCFLSVVFGSMGSIALGTPGNMRTTTKCRMSPLSTVLTLWNTWVHVGIFDSSDKTSNVETMIDDVLCQKTTLGIPDVHPDHRHVQFGRCFDNARL